MKLAALWLFPALLIAACGDPCSREARIAERRCGFELAPEGNAGEAVCDGLAEKEARCAVRHKAEFCDWLAALEADTVVENDYTRCLLE